MPQIFAIFASSFLAGYSFVKQHVRPLNSDPLSPQSVGQRHGPRVEYLLMSAFVRFASNFSLRFHRVSATSTLVARTASWKREATRVIADAIHPRNVRHVSRNTRTLVVPGSNLIKTSRIERASSLRCENFQRQFRINE